MSFKDKAMNLTRNIFYFISVGFGTILIVITIISQFHSNNWYLEIMNFPRLSILIALPVCGFAFFFLASKKNIVFVLFMTGILVSIVLQAKILFPYSIMANPTVKSISSDAVKSEQVLGIMVANVLESNRNSDGLLKLIAESNPNLLLTMEVDKWWVNRLLALDKKYPFKIVFPTDNTYGMALYSKFPLSEHQLYFLTNKNVPSISCIVTLTNGTVFRLIGVHPVAPIPSDHPDNMGEKADGLLKAAYLVARKQMPTIVVGDFNDVGWSYNTTRFAAISKLNDVRYGRGLYNTFSAQSYLLKWPLDHIYVSDEFKVLALERLSNFGSDHYPFYAQIAF